MEHTFTSLILLPSPVAAVVASSQVTPLFHCVNVIISLSPTCARRLQVHFNSLPAEFWGVHPTMSSGPAFGPAVPVGDAVRDALDTHAVRAALSEELGLDVTTLTLTSCRTHTVRPPRRTPPPREPTLMLCLYRTTTRTTSLRCGGLVALSAAGHFRGLGPILACPSQAEVNRDATPILFHANVIIESSGPRAEVTAAFLHAIEPTGSPTVRAPPPGPERSADAVLRAMFSTPAVARDVGAALGVPVSSLVPLSFATAIGRRVATVDSRGVVRQAFVR